jgi:hypothetical protein
VGSTSVYRAAHLRWALFSPLTIPHTINPCGAACSATTISQGGFAQTSLKRFNFTVGSTSTFNATHDDGVALFTAGTTATASDLFAVADSSPMTSATTETITLAPGSYDLWFVEANGVPGVLTTNLTPLCRNRRR